MAATQRKMIAWITVAGLGVVLAANPSGAMPWGERLRPSFVTEALGAPSGAADDGPAGGSGPDPTIAKPTHEHDADAPPLGSATGVPAGRPASAGPAGAAPTSPPSAGAAGAGWTVTEGAALAGAEPNGPVPVSEPPRSDPSRTEPPNTDSPTTDPPTTARRGDDRTPATLTLACRLQAGAARADVACAWRGATPDGAARMLVLRSDASVGRVRLATDDVARRSWVDADAGAGRTFSYVIVFLDGAGKTIGHSNGVTIVTSTVPTPPTTAVPEPRPTAPRPPEPRPTTTTPRPTEPRPTTTTARPTEPRPTVTPTTVAGEPRR